MNVLLLKLSNRGLGLSDFVCETMNKLLKMCESLRQYSLHSLKKKSLILLSFQCLTKHIIFHHEPMPEYLQKMDQVF